jgi:YVTN family beta-propeller protein
MIVLPHHLSAQTLDTIINERKSFNQSPQIKVDRFPLYVTVNPAENKIYVANHDSNTVSVIDSNSGNVTNDIRVGTGPSYMTVDTTENKIYVANEGDNTVSVIDALTIIR